MGKENPQHCIPHMKVQSKQLLSYKAGEKATVLREQFGTSFGLHSRIAGQYTFITLILYNCIIFTVYGGTISFMKYTLQLHIWLYYFQHCKFN